MTRTLSTALKSVVFILGATITMLLCMQAPAPAFAAESTLTGINITGFAVPVFGEAPVNSVTANLTASPTPSGDWWTTKYSATANHVLAPVWTELDANKSTTDRTITTFEAGYKYRAKFSLAVKPTVTDGFSWVDNNANVTSLVTVNGASLSDLGGRAIAKTGWSEDITFGYTVRIDIDMPLYEVPYPNFHYNGKGTDDNSFSWTFAKPVQLHFILTPDRYKPTLSITNSLGPVFNNKINETYVYDDFVDLLPGQYDFYVGGSPASWNIKVEDFAIGSIALSSKSFTSGTAKTVTVSYTKGKNFGSANTSCHIKRFEQGGKDAYFAGVDWSSSNSTLTFKSTIKPGSYTLKAVVGNDNKDLGSISIPYTVAPAKVPALTASQFKGTNKALYVYAPSEAKYGSKWALQKKVGTTYKTVATGAPGAKLTASSLTANTSYSLRLVAYAGSKAQYTNAASVKTAPSAKPVIKSISISKSKSEVSIKPLWAKNHRGQYTWFTKRYNTSATIKVTLKKAPPKGAKYVNVNGQYFKVKGKTYTAKAKWTSFEKFNRSIVVWVEFQSSKGKISGPKSKKYNKTIKFY